MKFLAVCAFLPLIFFVSACDPSTTNHRWFAHYLQGTWVPNAASPAYRGTLEITFDRITITGFEQTPWNPNNPYRPFRNFPRNVALSGFSEGARVNGHRKGHIFIEDGGLRPGISYLYRYADEGSPNFRRVHLLNLYFGGEATIFERREPEGDDSEKITK